MTGGWTVFDSRIEALDWGGKTHTILRLPDEVVAALGPAARVEAEIAEHPVNLAITRAAAVAGAFLWAGQSLLDRIGLAPGDRVTVRLRPAPDDHVETPEDLSAALLRAGALPAWEALGPGKRRGMIYLIDTARRPATRARRIDETVQGLMPP
jgi:hypothetical protein